MCVKWTHLSWKLLEKTNVLDEDDFFASDDVISLAREKCCPILYPQVDVYVDKSKLRNYFGADTSSAEIKTTGEPASLQSEKRRRNANCQTSWF